MQHDKFITQEAQSAVSNTVCKSLHGETMRVFITLLYVLQVFNTLKRCCIFSRPYLQWVDVCRCCRATVAAAVAVAVVVMNAWFT